ncbi:unnamed protein product [Rodentolepis nana]|uniref:DDE_Tnp_1_7 domain-containing protein n=1 Tax=Rodentolepis nana TaxID=102285 RepID=A0A0R3TI24_RODNA|nr:unnamed protein product [Rodentolepis nana]
MEPHGGFPRRPAPGTILASSLQENKTVSSKTFLFKLVFNVGERMVYLLGAKLQMLLKYDTSRVVKTGKMHRDGKTTCHNAVRKFVHGQFFGDPHSTPSGITNITF